MKKVLSAVVAVGALAIGVSACSSKSSGAAPAAPTAQQETLVYHSSWQAEEPQGKIFGLPGGVETRVSCCAVGDRKSTRLNSSHVSISYAVFCFKKKKT